MNAQPSQEELNMLAQRLPSVISDTPESKATTLSGLPYLYGFYLLEKHGQMDAAAKSVSVIFPRLANKNLMAVESSHRRRLFDPDSDPECPLERILSLRNWEFSRPLLETLAAAPNCDPVFTYLLQVYRQQRGDSNGSVKLQNQADAAISCDLPRRLYLA